MRTEVILNRAFQMLLLTSALAPAAVLAQEANQPKTEQVQTDKAQAPEKPTDQKATSSPAEPALGMSIVGNHEAPKALVLVPWKPSEPGKTPEISTKVDDSRTPIDKEVFMRMLQYHEIARTNAAPHDTAAAPRRNQ